MLVLAALLAGGGFALAKRAGFGIFADTISISNVTVLVKKDSNPLSGAMVSVDDKTFGTGSTGQDGKVTSTLNYGSHKFQAGFPPDCNAQKTENISRATQTVNLDITCGVATPIPTVTTTSTATATKTATATVTSTPAPSGKGTLNIYVSDKSGAPLVATAGILTATGNLTGGTTDSSGFRQVKNLATPAGYRVKAQKTGYQDNVQEISLNAGETKEVRITLYKDGESTPVAATTPTVMPPPVGSTSTVVPTQFDIWIVLSAIKWDGATYDYIKGIRADLLLDGKKIGRYGVSNEKGQIDQLKVLTIQDGIYSIEFSGPGNYDYGKANFSFTKNDLTLYSGASRSIYEKYITLEEKYVQTIKIVDEKTKNPIPNAKFELEETGCGFYFSKVADSNGIIVFDNNDRNKIYAYRENQSCYQQSAVLKISAQDYISGVTVNAEILIDLINAITGKREFNAEISLNKKGAGISKNIINGSVVDEKKTKIADVKLTLLKDYLPTGSWTKSNKDGAFSFSGISPGRYMITPFHLNFCNRKGGYTPFTVNENESIELEIPITECVNATETLPRKISTEVFDKDTLAPIKDVAVYITAETGEFENGYTDYSGKLSTTIEIKSSCNAVSVEIRYPDPTDSTKTISKINKLALEKLDPESGSLSSLRNYTTAFYIESQNKIKKSDLDIKFIVVDEAGAPASGVFVDGNQGNVEFSGLTNKDGEINFARDFTAFISSFIGTPPKEVLDNILAMNYISNSGLTRFSFSGKGASETATYSCILNSDNHKTIRIQLKNIGVSDSISGCSIITPAPIPGASAGTGEVCLSYLDKIGNSLESYQNIELYQSDTENGAFLKSELQQDISNPCFSNVPLGKYYKIKVIKLDSSEIFSGIKKLENTCRINLEAQDCLAKDEIKNYGDQIYFVLSDEAKRVGDDGYYKNLAEKIKKLSKQSKSIRPLLVYFDEEMELNAYANSVPKKVCSGDNKIIENAKLIGYHPALLSWQRKNGLESGVFSVIAHEYGHQVDFANYDERLVSLFDSLKSTKETQQCVWDRIKDGYIGDAPGGFGGHPADDKMEMFATFYSDFFTNHERLYGFIKYRTVENSACQNVLKYLWQYFSENVGKYYDNDDKYFIPVGGKIGSTDYSYEQIRKGDWLQENFDKKTLKEKIAIQYQRLITPVFKTFSKTKLTGAVSEINRWVNEQLSKLGLLGDTGNVHGTITDQNGNRIADAVVQIGVKFGKTNTKGEFFISKVPSGRQKVEKIKTKNGIAQIQSPMPAFLEIKKGETKSVSITVTTLL